MITSHGFCGNFCNTNAAILRQPSIKEVTTSTNYLNTTVKITGVFKGNDSKIGPPPVTRSDFILEDATGQIFVTGLLPKGLTRKDIGKTITLNAIVRSTVLNLMGKKLKIIYLERK